MRTQTIAPVSRAHRPFPASLTVRIDTAPCVGECDAALLVRYPISPALISSVTNYYGYNLKQEIIGQSMNSAHRLADLPLALRCEAVECLTRDALSKVPLFALAEEDFQIALIQSINQQLRAQERSV